MIGTNVRTKREAKGMTQVALAEAVESIQSTISAIENGTRQPSVSMLVRLSAALGCSADELLQSSNGDNNGGVAQDDAPVFGSVLR